jgi:tRNA dimethylallyltransferase
MIPESGNNVLITILGPTACGKTRLAVRLAGEIDGEILSADSRQVYSGMDIGTGKDLSEYELDGKSIPYHLIDIAEAGYKYNVFEFQRDFIKAFNDVVSRNKQPVLCGGTGLYLESVIKGYNLMPVPVNRKLRNDLEEKSLDELARILSTYKNLHNSTDTDTIKRAVRAIEIEEYYCNNPEIHSDFPKIGSIVFGLEIEREERRKRISTRLKDRLQGGMIEEIQQLINKGIKPDDLIYYGLEYKYVTLYITGKLSFQEMFGQLEIAIHQFAKRQMTWFRGMEKRGIKINWLNALNSPEENVKRILEIIRAC